MSIMNYFRLLKRVRLVAIRNIENLKKIHTLAHINHTSGGCQTNRFEGGNERWKRSDYDLSKIMYNRLA